MQNYYVYILANKKFGSLYTGITSNLINRVWQHKTNQYSGFTAKYNIHLLVFYEIHRDVLEAIKKEKQIKAWRRDWKINLIGQFNPEWEDLYGHIIL